MHVFACAEKHLRLFTKHVEPCVCQMQLEHHQIPQIPSKHVHNEREALHCCWLHTATSSQKVVVWMRRRLLVANDGGHVAFTTFRHFSFEFA